MAVATTALCNLDEVKAWGSMTGARDADDELIEDLCDRVTDMFEKYCGVDQFTSGTATEYIDGNGTEYLFVKNVPLNSVTLLRVDPDWTWGSDDEVDSDDYRIQDDRYIVSKSYWSIGNQNIKITYTYGYSTIPGDLKQAAIEEVLRKYTRRKEVDLKRKDLAEGGMDFVEPGLLKNTVNVLNRYKRMRAL